MRAVRVAFVLLLASLPVSATSYVPMTDAALVDQAPVIAVVEVQGSGGPEVARPYTAYRVSVERVLKGPMAPGLGITVRVPGGTGAGGLNLRIWGAPRFAKGERALLFLSPRLDGSYSIVHLMLGAFHEVAAGGHRFAVRNLSEARAIVRPGEPVSGEPRRDFDRFVSWIASRVRGVRVRADYEVAAVPGLDSIAEAFTLFEDPETGYNLRWFDFEDGDTVEWLAHVAGQEGVAGGGFAELLTALAAWNDDPGTNIAYTYGGTTSDTTGLTDYDELNTIIFNDPNGELPAFNCLSGGILAYAGPWYYPGVTHWRGTPYHRIANADVVVNNGITCFFEASPDASAAAEELFAHELGHTLGLDHSEVPEALMVPELHDDGRGALLHADDRAAIANLYFVPQPTDFYTLTPCRLIDTRDAEDGPELQPGQVRTFEAAGRCGVPETAVSISINITVLSPTGAGRLTLFPADRFQPSTSSVNFSSGKTVANNAILLLSGTPERAFMVAPTFVGDGTAHLLVDVNGYFK